MRCASRRPASWGKSTGGWYVAQTTLSFERSNVGSAIGQRQLVEDICVAARESFPGGIEPTSRTRLAERWIECGVAFLLSCAIVSRQSSREADVSSDAAQAKLYSMELNQRIYSTAWNTFGLPGQLLRDAMTRPLPAEGGLPAALLRSVANSIEGGTSEIQRGIIATRKLGLPRG